jgi:uncharacterized repeat protein (TIGR01451 family)
MLALKWRTEIMIRTLLIAVILFNALMPTSAKASSARISKDVSKSYSLAQSKHGETSAENTSTETNLQTGNSNANLAPASLTISNTYYVDTLRTTLAQNASGNMLYIADSTGFAPGDEVLVMSMQGTQAGQYETVYVDQVQVNSLQLLTNLQYTYDITAGSVMVQKVPNLGDVTVASGGNITAHAWDGSTGGVVYFRAGIVTIDTGGKISASGLGYRGGNKGLTNAYQGESYLGLGTIAMEPNGGGGGAGRQQTSNSGGGGGGGYGTNGANGGWDAGFNYGRGGVAYGTANLEKLYLGSGGGGGAGYSSTSCGAPGGAGGGVLVVLAQSITVSGGIEANGIAGGNSPCDGGGGGGGSGGSILLSATDLVLNTNKVQAIGGPYGTAPGGAAWHGGAGGVGRIRLDFTNASGTTNPSPGYTVSGITFALTSDSPKTVGDTTPITLTATVQNQNGLPVPNEAVELGITAGSSLYINNQLVGNLNQYVKIGNTNASGIVTATLKTFTSGTRTVRARLQEQSVIAQEAMIEFSPGPVSANMSDLSPSTGSAPANGQTSINLTVTAFDANNNAIPNASVVWHTTGSAVIVPSNQSTDSQGKVTAQVTDAVDESVTITATVNGTTLQDQSNLTFTGADMALSASAATEAIADTSLTYNITVQNISGITMQNASLQVQLPQDITFTSHTAPSEPTQTGPALSWSLGTFNAGQKLSFSIIGHISASAALGSTLSMQANVSSTTADGNPGNNTATVNTTIVDGHNFIASITPSSNTLGLGATANYQISIQNTGLIADQFNLNISGLDAGWYTLSETTVSLLPQQTTKVSLEVQINSCSAAGDHPFQVDITSAAEQEVKSQSASVRYETNPILSEFTPENGRQLGSQDVTISWRSDVPSAGTLTLIKPGGQTETFSTSSGIFSSIVVPDLERNATYEWFVDAVSPCGTTTSSHRQFTVGNGIVFVNRNQSFTIDRDYDQRKSISVHNDDVNLPHTLKVSVTNPYEDILVNFVDSGSQDQTITLQPGETRQVTLAIHTQDAQLDTYDLSATLVADESSVPIYDNMNLHVTVLSDGNFDIVEDEAAFDPVTLGRTYVITNHGRPITDLSLKAIDPDTGLPAKIFLQPSLDHARIETGQSIRVVAYPVYTAEDSVAHANLLASINSNDETASLDAVNQENSADNGLLLATYPILTVGGLDGQADPLASSSASMLPDPGDINFELEGSGAGNTISTGPLTTSCGTTKQIVPVTIGDCKMTFETKDWYCTNKPVINTPIQVPAFLKDGNINSADLKVTYQPHDALNHSGQINFNDYLIGSFADAIPNGQQIYNIASSYWKNGVAGNVIQTVNMNTQHSNDAHYVSVTGYQLEVNVNQATAYVCADSTASAQQIAQATYACTAPPSSIFNYLTDVFWRSIFNAGQNKTVQITAKIENDSNVSNTACTVNCKGDPINTHTGVFSFTLADLAFPTSAGDLVFQRSYSSGSVEYAAGLGYGWTHNHDAKLIFPTDPSGMEGFMLFQGVLGNQYLFKIETDGSFTPGPGVLATLIKSSTAPLTYTLTDSQQAIFKFNENGRLILRQDAQGHAFNYDYDAQDRLIKVSADGGAHFLQIGYDVQGHINSVNDYANRQISYAYNAAGDLTSVTDVLGQTWTYAYDAEHHMTQANDPAGTQTVKTEYDSEGRANRQFDGEGNLIVQIVYNSDGTTSVYDALGHLNEDQYNEHNIATQTVDPLGRTETKTFNDKFRPTEITNSANQSLTMEWSPDGVNLLTKIDPAGNQTDYTYDALNTWKLSQMHAISLPPILTLVNC